MFYRLSKRGNRFNYDHRSEHFVSANTHFFAGTGKYGWLHKTAFPFAPGKNFCPGCYGFVYPVFDPFGIGQVNHFSHINLRIKRVTGFKLLNFFHEFPGKLLKKII